MTGPSRQPCCLWEACTKPSSWFSSTSSLFFCGKKWDSRRMRCEPAIQTSSSTRRIIMNLGINLSFAVKRWVEPPVWAQLVRETFGLELVQFTYDLLDPWWPEASRRPMTAEVRKAASDWGLQIESAFSGLANYCFDGLLHPD